MTPEPNHFDRETRTWYVDPDTFHQVRTDAIEDEMHGRDPGVRYLSDFGPGAVTIVVVRAERTA